MSFEEALNSITYSTLEMFDLAEQMFGNREKDWSYIGIEFKDDGPYLYYYSKNMLSIVLSTNSSKLYPTHPQLHYQLSHEICHLLYPTGKADANVLNEGISTYFSKIWQERKYPNSTYAIDSIMKSNYKEAYQLVEKLMNSDPKSIKKIREIKSSISYVTKEELESLNFQLTDTELDKLVLNF